MLELICRRTCSTCRRAVRLLEENGVDYTYREYTEEPLSVDEIRRVLDLLGARPGALLRRHDRAYGEAALNGDEDDDTLIERMAEHPTLLQRPIAIVAGRAVVGRPPEKLLDLL